MKQGLFVLLTLAVGVGPAPASPEEDEARAKALVKRLGSDEFRTRERAAKELIALGAKSRKALEEGCNSEDAGTAERCRKLLPLATECYLKDLVYEQVLDPRKPLPEDLPGLRRWVEIVGESVDSKLLFLEMLTKHHEFLADVTGKPQALVEEYPLFVRDLAARTSPHERQIRAIRKMPPEPLTQADMAVFLFLATDARFERDKVPGGWKFEREIREILSDELWTHSLGEPYGRESFRTLIAEYMTRELGEEVSRRTIQLALTLELKRAVPSLLKIAGNKKCAAGSRTFALAAAGKLAGREILPGLVSLLDDSSPVGVSEFDKQKRTIEMRDVALGTALVMTKQKLTDYGFDRGPPEVGSDTMLSNQYFSFPSDEARRRGMKKWGEFVAEEKLLPETKN